MKKQIIVLSGANITSGGPLTIFNDALKQISEIDNTKIIAIVSNKKIFYTSKNIHFIELPYYKKIILLKFYFEYVYYYFISKRIKPSTWISLNDFTPNVSTNKLYTYFHNASLFFSPKLTDYIFSLRSIFQKFYYSYFFRFFLQENTSLIVQQDWLGNKIHQKYKLPKSQITLFRPHINFELDSSNLPKRETNTSIEKKIIFFYPTTPYSYKNIEIICDALEMISSKKQNINIELRLTISGNENLYTKYLKFKYKELPISWLGQLTRTEVEKNYIYASALVFPSRLESWGLPLSEFTKYKKPIIAIDLEYARETLDNYPYKVFFNPGHTKQLSEVLMNVIENKNINFSNSKIKNPTIFKNIKSWKELLST